MTEREFLQAVGAKVREVRKSNGVALIEIQKAGITTAWNMSRIENGHKGFNLLTLKRVADFLHVDIRLFFTYEETT